MSRRVGICPVCETQQRLRWMTGVAHVIAMHRDGPVVGSADGGRCGGVGMLPLATSRQSLQTRKLLALVEPFRTHAAVALDAWIEGRDYPECDVDILCRVAMFEYRARHPTAHLQDSILQMKNRGRRDVRGSYDAYCLFCRSMVYGNIKTDTWGPPFDKAKALDRSGHAVECALKHLAFALQPAEPTFRRLPDEFLQVAD